MPKPHKHAELIKAWADGVEIEYRFRLSDFTSWSVVKYISVFDEDLTDSDNYQFRIKQSVEQELKNKFESWSHENLAKFAKEAEEKINELNKKLDRADERFYKLAKFIFDKGNK